jgi:serine/threonine-protein kinase HipA
MDDNGQGERLHQEDFCQALGIDPELKIRTKGGPI